MVLTSVSLMNKPSKSDTMEHLNKIEIKGTIGNVRIQDVADNKVANFSVATDYVYKSKNGEIIIETTCYPKASIIKT